MFKSHNGIFGNFARINGTDFYGAERSEKAIAGVSQPLVSLLSDNGAADDAYSLGGFHFDLSDAGLPGTLVSPVSAVGSAEGRTSVVDPATTATLEDMNLTVVDYSEGGLFGLPCVVDSKELLMSALNSVNGAGFQQLDVAPSATDVPVTVGSQTVGTIDVDGEVDTYTVDLVAGQRYVFSLRGSGATAVNDTFLQIVNPSNVVVATDDDGGNGLYSLITYTAQVTGTFTINASCFANPGDPDLGEYTLDVLQMTGIDTVPNNLSTPAVLTVGSTTIGFRETAGANSTSTFTGGDADLYKVHLEAGKNYQFNVAGGHDYASGTSLAMPVGEINTLITLFTSGGVQITGAQNNDIATNDRSSSLTFYAQTTGDYFLQVTGAGVGGAENGRNTGGYIIDVKELDTTGLDPLDAINWKSAGNIPTVMVGGVETAYVYFAVAGENFGENARAGDPTQAAGGGNGTLVSFGWNATEKAAFMNALAEYTKITGITYVETNSPVGATFRAITTNSNAYGAYAYPQDAAYGTQKGILAFNVNSGGWDKLGVSTQDLPGDQVSLQKGGFAFGVMLHELGHAHGLAHPHDNGGGSDIIPGVVSAEGSYGVYQLNQGVYTVMSYNEAWDFHPDGKSPFTIAGIDNGWSLFGALDIKELQDRYGIHDSNTGDTVYTLTDVIDLAYYNTIWDTGGNDTIAYSGTLIARIDLLAATVDYSATGGGAISYLDNGAATTGLRGGFTIANGVVIENATGGSGNDVLLGNAAANTLTGNDGSDTLMGREGNDTLIGGAGNDTMVGGADYDTAVFSGARSDYTVTYVSPGVFSVVDNRGGSPDGTDSIDGVERVLFSNGDYYVEADGTLTQINDAPTGTDSTHTFVRGTPYTLSASDFGFVDVDGNSLASVTINSIPATGRMFYYPAGGGQAVPVTAGFVVTAADLAAGRLIFKPGLASSGPASSSYTFTVKDDGGTAHNGVDTDPTPNTLTLTTINQAPTGSNVTIAAESGVTRVLTAADFGFSDVDGNLLSSVIIDTLPGNGSLRLDGVKITTVNVEVSAADIAAGKLTYRSAGNATIGTSSTVNFQVRDNGGTANGGVDLDQSANTLTIGVANHAPNGTDNTVMTPRGFSHVVTAAEFGFNDVDGNAFVSVTITSLPSQGRLTLDGVKVTAGQVILVSDINAGKLAYRPTSDVTYNLASYTFQVHDDGGTAFGANDTDQTPNTLTFNAGAPPAAVTGDVGGGAAGKTGLVETKEAIPVTGDVHTTSTSGFDLLSHLLDNQGTSQLDQALSSLIGDPNHDLGALVDAMDWGTGVSLSDHHSLDAGLIGQPDTLHVAMFIDRGWAAEHLL